jgi:hypothetical protein
MHPLVAGCSKAGPLSRVSMLFCTVTNNNESGVMKKDFKKFLLKRLKPRSIDSYLSALNHISSHLGNDIYSITDVGEAEEIRALYDLQGKHSDIGEYSNGCGRNAVSYYCKYLQALDCLEVSIKKPRFIKIPYKELKPKQQEIYNFQKVAAILAEYSFNCIKLADDWLGADFIAYHFDGIQTLRVQLKGRMTIDKKYLSKDLHVAFMFKEQWYLVDHDLLVDLVGNYTNWLNTKSWIEKGNYHSQSPNQDLIAEIAEYAIG